MPKTLYEGYRIGKDGGERWSGTIRRPGKTDGASAPNGSGTTDESRKPRRAQVWGSAFAEKVSKGRTS